MGESTEKAPPKPSVRISALGLLALGFGTVGTMWAFMPQMSRAVLPFGVIAVCLGVLGFIMSAATGKTGRRLPLGSAVLGLLALAIYTGYADQAVRAVRQVTARSAHAYAAEYDAGQNSADSGRSAQRSGPTQARLSGR
jgi:hypothetical protein